MTTTDLTTRQTVAELVATYERAVTGIRVGFARVARAEDELTAAFDSGSFKYTFSVRDKYNHHGIDFDDPESCIAVLKREVWKRLVDRLEIRRMISIQRATQLDQQLEREEWPEITVENVLSWANGIQDKLPDMIQEAVEEVFDWLRPRGQKYKTNSEFEIGQRVILTWVLEETQWQNKFHVSHYSQKHLTALENVFTALDGQGMVAKGSWQSVLADAINTTPLDVGRGETDYFKFKCFKNRNLHLEFKRPDLVDKLNKMAGGMRLRDKRGEAA